MLAPQWQCTPQRGCLGASERLDPWASSETRALVRGTPDRFLTPLSNCIVVAVVVSVVVVSTVVVAVIVVVPAVVVSAVVGSSC